MEIVVKDVEESERERRQRERGLEWKIMKIVK